MSSPANAAPNAANTSDLGDSVASTSLVVPAMATANHNIVATAATSTSSSSSKKKKKAGKSSSTSTSSSLNSPGAASSSASSHFKGKSTQDKPKSALSTTTNSSRQDVSPAVTSGDDDDENDSDRAAQSASSAAQGKKSAPSISDNLYRKIKQQAAAAGEDVSKLDKQSVTQMVEALRLRDVISGKSSGVNAIGRNKKDMADFKFWSTQPVPRLGSLTNITHDGPIEQDKPPTEVRQQPYPLPKDFEWSTIDLADPAQLKEVYELLTNNYVEDIDATFRFDYSAEFIRWALQPPGFIKEWHVGVRVSASKRLVAFIAGIPMNLRIRQAIKRCSEINYLCVHKKLRSKRLAPVLIKEVTRRCNLLGVFQAIYTVGSYLPTPVTACQYYHRSLNSKKLVDTGFSSVPRSSTLARMIMKNKLPEAPSIAGLREVEDRDLKQVADLLRAYLSRFDIAPVLSDDEVRHNFLSGRGRIGAKQSLQGPRSEQVTWTYVVEDPDTHLVTDFFSFYTLPSTAIRTDPQQTIQAAYLFYYATSECPTCQSLLPATSAQSSNSVVNWDRESTEDRAKLKTRLNALIQDSLIVANNAKFDVFNSLTLMDNNLFLADQKFGPGDGTLFFYLYNYQTRPIAGGYVAPAEAAAGVRQPQSGQTSGGFVPDKGSGVGVVML